jgi:hypothetical protein
MDVRETEHLSILAMQINRINELSIKLGGFQFLWFFWCRNICSTNPLFCHTVLNFNWNMKRWKTKFWTVVWNLCKHSRKMHTYLHQNSILNLINIPYRVWNLKNSYDKPCLETPYLGEHWHHIFWLQHLFKNHIELPIVAQLSKCLMWSLWTFSQLANKVL